MKKFSYILASAFLAIFIVGCASLKPIANRSELVPAGATVQEVNNAIITAANTKGWSLKPNGQNSYIAMHQRSSLSATVRIDYSDSAYSVSYVSTTGFKTDANGNIHNNYNRWVNNLVVEIRNTLSQQANLRNIK